MAPKHKSQCNDPVNLKRAGEGYDGVHMKALERLSFESSQLGGFSLVYYTTCLRVYTSSVAYSGRTMTVMSFTPEEKETLEVFRKQVFDEEIIREGDSVGTDDATLLRFLRARKFNLTESKKMLQNCQQWRKTVGGDGIDALYARLDPYDYPEREEIFKSWSMYFHKTDKKGRPVNIQFFGGLNLPKLYKHVTPERHWEAIVVNADSLTREVLPAASRAAGKHIHQSIVIVDLKGFGLSQFWQVKSLAQASFQISQDYFPETMGQLLIINAPSSFTFIWGIIKPWLAKETVEKVDILGSNYREVLLDVIDAENLPEILGGTCTCKGEGGCDLSGAGPWMVERNERKRNGSTEDSGSGEKTEDVAVVEHNSPITHPIDADK